MAVAVVIGLTLLNKSEEKTTLSGTFVLTDSDGFTGSTGACFGTGGYDDFGPGMDVKIRNGDGKLIGTTNTVAYETPESDPSEESDEVTDQELFDLLYGDACVVQWEVDVPNNEDFYTVEIGRRGT